MVLVGLLGAWAATPANASTVSIDFSADPTQDKPVTVTVTGSSPRPRWLHVFMLSRGQCSDRPSFYRDSERLSPSGGVPVEGTFGASYTFTPNQAWTHRVCAYVVPDMGGTVDAEAIGEVTPRRIHASVRVVTTPSAAVSGQPAWATVEGVTEHARRLHVYLRRSGLCDTSVPSGASADRLSPSEGVAVDGAFSHGYSFTQQPYGSSQICAYITREGETMLDASAVGTVSLSYAKAPPADDGPNPRQPVADVAPANLLLPATGASGRMLSPTFTWASTDVARDILVLSYRTGSGFRPYIAVTWAGASWLPADGLRSDRKLLAAIADDDNEAEGWASFRMIGGQGAVKVTKAIDPGRYRWTVYTGRVSGSGRLVPSAHREFTVHGPTLRSLRVKTRSRRGSSTTSPGATDLRISVTSYADVRVELRRGGRRSVRKYSAGDGTTITAPVAWSCSRPGGRYSYRVVATDSQGKRRTVSGTFRPVSAARCRTMRQQEQRAKAARQREVDRRVAERRRAETAAQQQRVNRFKSNCRKLGGTPRLIGTSDGDYWVCVSPWGGTWNVPV